MADSFRYAVRDDHGRQPLTAEHSPEQVSDVAAHVWADTTGTWVTLTDQGRTLASVPIDPQLGPLTLYRYPIGGGDVVTHPVTDDRPA